MQQWRKPVRVKNTSRALMRGLLVFGVDMNELPKVRRVDRKRILLRRLRVFAGVEEFGFGTST
jgi:hypothetical protein